jgi:hypothetical protein
MLDRIPSVPMREESPLRKARQVARRYVEGMEAERAGLKKQIDDLSRALDDASRHHDDAHAGCAGGPRRSDAAGR